MSLPPGWVETTLGEIAETKLGKMLDGAKNKGEPTSYLRNISVRWGSFDLDDLPTMPVTSDEFNELVVRNGDLFVCEGGVPGRCAVWRHGPERIVFQKAIHRVRPLCEIDPDYVQRYLAWSAGNAAFDHLLTGTTIKHLPQVGLQRIVLPLPPLAEQRRIVAKLDTLTARLRRARAELDRVATISGGGNKELALLDRLEAAILARAFRGELVPQDPADEPAAVLLDRIRAERAATPRAKRGGRAIAA